MGKNVRKSQHFFLQLSQIYEKSSFSGLGGSVFEGVGNAIQRTLPIFIHHCPFLSTARFNQHFRTRPFLSTSAHLYPHFRTRPFFSTTARFFPTTARFYPPPVFIHISVPARFSPPLPVYLHHCPFLSTASFLSTSFKASCFQRERYLNKGNNAIFK